VGSWAGSAPHPCEAKCRVRKAEPCGHLRLKRLPRTSGPGKLQPPLVEAKGEKIGPSSVGPAGLSCGLSVGLRGYGHHLSRPSPKPEACRPSTTGCPGRLEREIDNILAWGGGERPTARMGGINWKV